MSAQALACNEPATFAIQKAVAGNMRALNFMLARNYLKLSPGSAVPPGAETKFYESLVTSTGIRKTTAPGRLDRVNQLFFEVLGGLALEPKTIMDVGISSGVTTLEWLQEFDRRGMDVEMIGTDANMTAYLYKLSPSFHVLADRNRNLLQLELFGFAVRPYHRKRDMFTGGVIWRPILRRIASRLLPAVSHEGPLYLVTPLLRNQGRVQLIDDDILQPNSPALVRSADVVRVANLIQHEYLDARAIARAVENVRQRCRGKDSLVIVCRNQPALSASILRMNAERRFVVQAREGGGSEVEEFFTSNSRFEPCTADVSPSP